MFKLYRDPEPNEVIVIAADPADGGSDYCAAVAKSKKHADSLMTFKARTESSQFGYELFKMATFIYKKTRQWPLIGVERNTGGATIYVLRTLNYSQLYKMKSFDTVDQKEEERFGWVTNTQTRPKMLDDLAMSVRQRVNKIYDEDTINQLMSFIRNPRNGKPEAAPGTKDDLVIAEAIAWQLYTTAKVRSLDSLADATRLFPDSGLPDYAR